MNDADRKKAASDQRKLRNAVLASSAAKNGARNVLRTLIWEADFYKNEVRLSKEQITELASTGIRTVKRSLKFLRDEGSIKAIKHATGGYACATTYSFHVVEGRAGAQNVDLNTSVGETSNDLWEQVKGDYRATDEAGYKAWVHKLEFASIEGGHLRVKAPTAFHAAHVQTHIADALLSIASGHDQSIKRITIVEP